MKVGIASDHGGYQLKQNLIKYLQKKGYTIVDYGTSSKQSVDYPDYAFALCLKVVEKEVDLGIAICTTGVGISIACNKVKGIRCAKIDNLKEAKNCRLHNDANVIALNGEMSSFKAKDLVDLFLTTDYSKEERHNRRIDKISRYEQGLYGLSFIAEEPEEKKIEDTNSLEQEPLPAAEPIEVEYDKNLMGIKKV